MTLQVQLVKDDRYPVYEADVMDGTYPPWGLGIEWPVELDYDLYVQACLEYQKWQTTLSLLYKENEHKPWSTTNSPSATPTSSTPTS